MSCRCRRCHWPKRLAHLHSRPWRYWRSVCAHRAAASLGMTALCHEVDLMHLEQKSKGAQPVWRQLESQPWAPLSSLTSEHCLEAIIAEAFKLPGASLGKCVQVCGGDEACETGAA